jgi:transcriptional regulator
LLGHVAKANPVWQHESSVLAIFTGPQAYITPNAYPSKAEHHKVVPTYNYATVQVRGQLIAYTEISRKLAVVTALTDYFERQQPAPWAVRDAPANFIEANLNAIVAIEIVIDSVQGKFKLSQNRSAADQAGVRQYLSQASQANDHRAMLEMMQTDRDPTNSKP